MIGKASFKEAAQKLDETLGLVASLGVNWKTTRFESYKRRWEVAAKQTYPRIIRAKEFEEERYFFEAASQCQQLIRSSEIWDLLDRSLLAEKLRKIMCGDELPPSGNNDDLPRNTLLELTTAAMFSRQQFSVSITNEKADVFATRPGLPNFAIECKRPASLNSLEDNIRRIRAQLARRCNNAETKGVAVIGIDRVVNLSGALVTANTAAEAEKIVKAKTTKLAMQIQSIAQKRKFSLIEVPLGAVILMHTAYIKDEAMPYTIEQLTIFQISDSPRWHSLVKSVAPYFRT